MDSAQLLGEMRVPPGNRLEALRGRSKGQWSIRINEQYRICFKWTEVGPEDIEITEYHYEVNYDGAHSDTQRADSPRRNVA